MWVDGHKKARGNTNYLTLWKLIAPAGYVAMGLLASLGERTPNLEEVCPAAVLPARPAPDSWADQLCLVMYVRVCILFGSLSWF